MSNNNEARLKALRQKHQDLDDEIDKFNNSPILCNGFNIGEMKRQRLRCRDKIVQLEAQQKQ